MRRGVRITVAAVLVALILGALGWVAWLLTTNEGARWLLATVDRHSGVRITARQVEGRLLDHLRLTGVHLSMDRKEVELDSLDLLWRPLHLLTGRVDIRRLTLDGVSIRDDSPPSGKPPDFSWPRLPGYAEILEVAIARLEVTNLSYRSQSGEPFIITVFSSSIDWSSARLSLGDLRASSPSGDITGRIVAGFHRPTLQLNLLVSSPHPLAGMDQFTVEARLKQGRRPEQVAGRIVVSGAVGKKRLVDLAGELGIARDSLILRDVRLSSPARRGTITANGVVSLARQEPLVDLKLALAGLDLAEDLNVPTDLSGNVSLTGNRNRYRGRFALANRGVQWRTATLAGAFDGTGTELKLDQLTGSLLEGTLRGRVNLDWREGLAVAATLQGRSLNPAIIAPGWTGEINFDANGSIMRSGRAPLHGELDATLLDSRLHGQPLTGNVRTRFAGTDLTIDRLGLSGKGFNLHASGTLKQRVALNLAVSDLSLLLPGMKGELVAGGWMRLHEGRPSGSLTGRGRNMAAAGVTVATADLAARLDEGTAFPMHLALSLGKFSHGRLEADMATLTVDGILSRHTARATFVSSEANASIEVAGEYREGRWQGQISNVAGRDSVGPWNLAAPAPLAVSLNRASLAPLVLNGGYAERFEIGGEFARDPLAGTARVAWAGLNLERANPWLKDAQLFGSSNGSLDLRLMGGQRLRVAGEVSAQGRVLTDRQQVDVEQCLLDLVGGEAGVQAQFQVRLAQGGTVKGKLSSNTPARLAMPEEGSFQLEMQGVDLALLRPWLPEGISIAGVVGGRTEGKLLEGGQFELAGDLSVAGAKARRRSSEGEMQVNLRTASASWTWREKTLKGTVEFAMTDYGQAQGSFQVPLVAKLPAAMNRQGPISAVLTGRIREQGILTALMPGLVQESHGDIEADLKASGTWDEPRVAGTVRLARAGAYFPAAGITVRDVTLNAHMEKDRLIIDALQAASGGGTLTATAVILLQGRQVAGYRGSITGDNFQFIHLPELRVVGTPKLTFEGTLDRLAATGEIRLPELLVSGPTARKVIKPSEDVILEGEPLQEAGSRLALDVNVRVILGDRVLVKAEGIDAKLGGAIDLTMTSLDRITSTGEIRVVKGNYKTYGVDLKIERGRLFYAGGAIGQPTMDILAIRQVGDVRAGVTVAGTPQAPVVKLYSEPALPDIDILGYVVLGHPIGSGSGEQGNLMASAAGALLSAGQSVVLQDQIRQRLGISTLEVQTGTQEQTGLMGYKEIPVTPTGKAPARTTTGPAEAILTVGKYLTPQIYISYGRSLFTGGNIFRLRYDISKRWQIQTETGTESGADLYYKIEFQ